jgi:cellulose synthase/poly-beta-1,6-N-acetylglucosamine synthase-like glycosyltransferase
MNKILIKMPLTIGIPAYNEEKNIAKTLTNILAQLSSRDEIIVVASGCTDKTEDIVRELIKKDKRIKLITEKIRRGKPSAINLILKNAKGRVIIFTDADVKISKNAIKELIRHFRDKKIGAVGGRLIPILQGSYLDFWSKMSYRIMHEKRLKESEDGSLINISGNLMAIRKGIVKKIPLNSLVDDSTLAIMVKQKGYDIAYEPKAKVKVKTPKSLVDLIKQRARIRAGYYQLRKWFRVKERDPYTEASNFFIREFIRLKSAKEKILFLFISMFYFFSWIYGWWLLSSRKNYLNIWEQIKTTK